MDRASRPGQLIIDFPVNPFDSPLHLLGNTIRLFFRNFGMIAACTLLVYLPGHLLYQAAAVAFEIPSSGIFSAIALEVLDLVLSALVMPAIVFGLMQNMRNAPQKGALRWGLRRWLPMLVNQVKVEITVILYGALLIVPGVIAMIRLTFVPVIVAIEGDTQFNPLERSRQLAQRRFWRILLVCLPLTILDLAGNFLLLGRIAGVDRARILFAVAESLLAVAGQTATVAALLMYLGIAAPGRNAPAYKKTAKL
jgi:hypothetical protein